MARSPSARPLLLSVLDRLLDDSPESSREAQLGEAQFERELRAAIRRDVENLLNTRLRFLAAPADAAELRRSSYEYGAPDLSGANLSTRKRRAEHLKQIEAALKAHEPRFKSVKVVAVDDSERSDRTLHFRIEALVHAEPAPESMTLDSRVDPLTRTFHVRI